jgi:hypothetical protein
MQLDAPNRTIEIDFRGLRLQLESVPGRQNDINLTSELDRARTDLRNCQSALGSALRQRDREISTVRSERDRAFCDLQMCRSALKIVQRERDFAIDRCQRQFSQMSEREAELTMSVPLAEYDRLVHDYEAARMARDAAMVMQWWRS